MPSSVQSFLRRLKRHRTSHDARNLESESEPEAPVTAPKRGDLGLALLYDPTITSDESQKPAIDIVFVHRLNGDIVGTWTHANGRCWPKELLPQQFPSARIFSYGYDSRIFFSKSESEYRDFALGLLRDLHHLERNTGEVHPVIFVCHSLGGVVVKEVLNVAAERDWSLHVLHRTKGILFLGTPHRGSGIAGPATVLGNILEAVWPPVSFISPAPRKKLVSDLQRNSKMLFAISDRFCQKTEGIQIASFYETYQTAPLGNVVVDENSAVLGVSHERRWSMATNHRDICRFSDSKSPNYRAVVSSITEMIESIFTSRIDSGSERSLTNSEQACMERLATVDVVEFEARMDERLPNTLLWLSKDVHYNQWLTETSVRLLLVTGYAGCGKTILSSYLRTTLPNHALPASLICRFYCDAKEGDLSSAVALMRSMIYQTVQHSHHALRATVKAAKHDKWLWSSFERLWTLFETIATSDVPHAIIIIIDAVDELEDKTQKQITSRIVHLLQRNAKSTVKFVITSQPHAFAVAELKAHSTHLALELKQDVIGEDVNLYIVDRLKKLQMQKGWSDGTRERLTEVLQSKADRSFLWVSFTLSYLQNRDILDKADLNDALSQIPPDLTKFYHRFLTSITSRDAPRPALRLLNIVLASSRPLHINELAILLSIDSSHQSITEVLRDYAIRGVQSIQQALGPLVKVHNSKIQLVHTSLKDHLREFRTTYEVNETRGHELLAEKCMMYLLLQYYRQNSIETVSSSTPVGSPTVSLPGRNFEWAVADFDSSHSESVFGAIFEEPRALVPSGTTLDRTGGELYDYAMRFWATHFQQSHPAEGSHLHRLGVDLYTRLGQAHWTEHLRLAVGETLAYPMKPDALTVASFYGHETLLRRFLADPNLTDAQIGHAMYWASSRGYQECVQIIHSAMKPDFDHALCNYSGRNPLAAAAENGHLDCLQFLLQTQAFDPNHQDTGGRTALSLAAASGQDHIISMLLGLDQSYELDVNLADANGRSALFWACSANATTGVSSLLQDERINPNLSDRHHCDALSWACQDGLANIVRLFVDNPAVRLSNQDGKGNTPLICAVKSKDLSTVRALFRRGRRSRLYNASADLNIAATDAQGRNAISWAASTGDSKILALLLKHGSSEANVRDIDGWPPLAWTMDPPGFPQNTRALLPHCGETINDMDGRGSSLLSEAIIWGQFEIAKILIEQTEIDVDARSDAGRTPLSLAASSGSLDTVKLLLNSRYADPSRADNAGRLPSHWAQVNGHSEIAAYLETMTDAISNVQTRG